MAHFGMKAHIGVEMDFGLAYPVIGTSGNVANVVKGNRLAARAGDETTGLVNAGYQCVDNAHIAKEGVRCLIAMRPGKHRTLDKKNNPVEALKDQVEKIKANVLAKMSTPSR